MYVWGEQDSSPGHRDCHQPDNAHHSAQVQKVRVRLGARLGLVNDAPNDQ